jgi:Rrf2 family protein
VQAGILESVRGPKGGFRLAKPAQTVTVGDVVASLDGSNVLQRCVMGFAECGAENPCPLHPAWSQAKSLMHDSMTQITLQELQRSKARNRLLPKGDAAGSA